MLFFFHAKLAVGANFGLFCFIIKSYRVVWQYQVKTVALLLIKNTKQENLFPHTITHHLTNTEVRVLVTEPNLSLYLGLKLLNPAPQAGKSQIFSSLFLFSFF